MNRRFLLILLAAAPLWLAAQPYAGGQRGSQRFAQTTVGFDVQYAPRSGQSAWLDAGAAQPFALPGMITPRILISGLHFWGHADFYLAFPLASLRTGAVPVRYRYSSGVETGARFFPWPVTAGKIRPFAGVSMNGTDFRQWDRSGAPGAWASRVDAPVQGGLLFATGRHLVDLSVRYHYRNTASYHLSRSQAAEIRTPAWFVQLGVRKYFETTLSAEPGNLSGHYRRLEAAMGRSLSNVSLGLGMSSAFFLRQSPWLAAEAPWMSSRLRPAVFPELGLGYYFHGPDAHLNLALRRMRVKEEAYGFSREAGRSSAALEAYKFLGNYHGFAPFLGASLSLEGWRYRSEDEGQPMQDVQRSALRPGLTFGWDIRPTPVNSILLRTNLRWYPSLNLDITDGQPVALSQIEFNFIQVVWYPGRTAKVQRAERGM
ncbi:MAG: hypothetical protein NW241_07205 [Bacteroidia bacterium]|nr:hypothetical protein [Bacteroidia bacterium]